MAKKIKKAKKNRSKISPLDVVIFLLVLCLILVFAYRLYVGIAKMPENNNSKYVMKFECENEYNSILSYLSAGDAVYLSSTGELLGYLYEGDPTIEDAVYELVELTNNGKEAFIKDEYYHKIRLEGWLKLSVDTVRISSGDYYSIGDVNFSAGSKIEVYTEKAEFTIIVSDLLRNES